MGVPRAFEILYEQKVIDCHRAERLSHQRLDHCRSTGNREFFHIPIKAAIKALESVAEPRDGAIIFSDLIGKLDLLRVQKCGRDGRYGLSRLIDKHGRDGKVIDWLDELTADCPKKLAHSMYDRCGARCPDLAKVL